MKVVAIVLAAGAGTRFTAVAPEAPTKLLTPIEGRALIVHTLERLRSGGASQIVVVTDGQSVALRDVLLDAGVDLATNEDPARGMLSSIRAGLLPTVVQVDVVMVMPGDMPFVQPETVAAVIDAARESGRSVSPRFNDRGGHPVALSRRLRLQLANAPDDMTLRELLKDDDPIQLVVEDPGVIRDVDVPSDLA